MVRVVFLSRGVHLSPHQTEQIRFPSFKVWILEFPVAGDCAFFRLVWLLWFFRSLSNMII